MKIKFSDIPDYWDWYIWFAQNGTDSFKSLFKKQRAFCYSLSWLGELF